MSSSRALFYRGTRGLGLLVPCLLLWAALPTAEASYRSPIAANASALSWLSARVVTLRAPGATMIRVPGGRFSMGSTLDDIMFAAELCQTQAPAQVCQPQVFANERALHNVDLSSYWLDRTEVTVREYERCVTQRRCSGPPYSEGAMRFRAPEFPVSFVTWQDAERYCNWRGARLPTEAEFERAGRGLNQRQFPWGSLYNSRVSNHGRFGVADTDAKDGFDELAPVASFPSGATPDGFMDLSGNVAEWVFDLYAPEYPPKAVENPRGPEATGHGERIIRGGHFKSAPVWLRNRARQARSANERAPYVGFRCAKSSHARTKT